MADDLRPLDVGALKPALNNHLIVDERGLAQLESYFSRVKEAGHDIETNVVPSFYNRKIRTIQFGDRNEQYVIDLLKFAGSPESLTKQQGDYGSGLTSLRAVVDVIQPALENHDFTKIGHSLQFEYEVQRWCLGIRSTGFYDLLLAEKLLHSGTVNFMISGFWALDDVVGRYLKLQIDKQYQTSFNLEDPDLTQDQLNYAALDVRLPVSIKGAQSALLEKEGLSVAAQLEFDTLSAFGEMKLNGLPINREKWAARIERDQERLKRCISLMDAKFTPVCGPVEQDQAERDEIAAREERWRAAPHKTDTQRQTRSALRLHYMELQKLQTKRRKLVEKCEGTALINYGSGPQLSTALVALGFSKKDLPDTADETLKDLSQYKKLNAKTALSIDPTLESFGPVDLIRLYRSLAKAIGTYGWQWITDENFEVDGQPAPGLLNAGSGMLHPNIHQIGAATGRTSATTPNCQNLPQDADYRSCFGYILGRYVITSDFSGCELRLLAELSGDQVWIDAFNAGADIHSVTGELIFKEWKEMALPDCQYYKTREKCKCPKHKELRDKRLKILNFSIINGKTEKGLSEDMDIPVSEARDILMRWKKANPVINAYLEKAGKEGVANLMRRTMSGRIRRWLRPTWEKCKEWVQEDLPEGRQATQEQIRRKYSSVFGSIEREAKNTDIQGSNADVAKLAMYYIWRDGHQYGIKQHNFVHDENVCSAPNDLSAEKATQIIGDCMKKAGEFFVKRLVMEAEHHVAEYWEK